MSSVKQELLETIISRTDMTDLAEVCDAVMLQFDNIPDMILNVLDIKYVEPYEDETDGHWLNRIKNTEYGIVESFCNSCKSKNTEQTIEIAREKEKLIEFFECLFTTGTGKNIRNLDDFKKALSVNHELNDVHFVTVNDIIYALNLDTF